MSGNEVISWRNNAAMNELSVVENVEAKFEDLSIYIHTLIINPVFDLSPKTERVVALTRAGHSMVVHYSHPDKKSMVGGIMLIIRSQGEDDNLLLSVNGDISVTPAWDNNTASIFCKTVQYFYEFLGQYVKEKEIKDNNGKIFLMPVFNYSASHFEGLFPE